MAANQIYNVIREQANPSKVAVFLPLPNKVGRDDDAQKSKYLNVGEKGAQFTIEELGKQKNIHIISFTCCLMEKGRNFSFFFSGELSVAIYPRHGFT